MILRDLKIRCINLDRSLDRWRHVSSVYNRLIRISAVDGMKFSDGNVDSDGCPTWGKIPSDISIGQPQFFKMFPTTYGCNLSHLKAITDFLSSDEEWTIIVEDDTEPEGDLSTIHVPDDCDFFYLIGTSHPGCRLALYQDMQVRASRTLAAYALSRRAAAISLIAMVPIQWYQTDHQIPLRCFESTLRECWCTPDWEELPYRVKGYGQVESIIRHSKHAAVSTFTINGKKPWIPNSMLFMEE